MAQAKTGQAAPRHVGIIMDGNGRWATRRGLPRIAGHRAGADRVREIVEACPDLGITHLTLFAFSTENWKRSVEEVAGLMTLFRRYIQSETDRLVTEGVRVRFIGGRDRLNPRLVRLMQGLEAATHHNDRLHLTVAINYGGRDELMRAVARLVAEGITPDEQAIAGALDTAGLPDPDLVIRTSGEQRVSNFLLWQAAYAEYAFPDTLWPDFTAREFADILASVSRRERRFGAVRG